MAKKRRVPDALRQQARQRAHRLCEYCLIHEDDAGQPHEADHIIAERHTGTTTLENLAWACAACNRYKGADVGSFDPRTGRLVPFFHPRRQEWKRHFRLNGGRIEPRTSSGRATVLMFHLNDDWRVTERLGLIERHRYPRL